MPSSLPSPHYTPTESAIALGVRIRTYREALGMTLEQASSLFGLSTFTLASVETAVRPITLDTLDKIAGGMGLDVLTLVSQLRPATVPVSSVRVALLRAMEELKLAGEQIKIAYQAAGNAQAAAQKEKQ